jgi:protein tyrosine/serine phosphatase
MVVRLSTQVLVHCWGGGGRTGIAQAAYLMAAKGKSAEAAAEAVMTYGQAHGLSRRVDVAALKEFAAAAGVAPAQ